MNAPLLKRLFKAIQSGSPDDLDLLCRRVIDEEKKKGHEQVAKDLETIINEPRNRKNSFQNPQTLTQLPSNRRDSGLLVQEIPVENLRHDMVLPENVEKRFQRIEKEFAARSRLAKHGLNPRRNILLFGPPGCGKSLGAERLAWNTGLPLRKVRFDTLLSSYFGETLTNLRKIFDSAQLNPCVLLLDECDTLARSRNARNDVGEVIRITNALLEMLENFSGDGLIVATTNSESALDTALFRRFDEVLKIPLPGIEEISKLLRSTLSAIETEPSLPWKDLASAMDGMSGSEIVRIAQNAAKHCVLEGNNYVSSKDIKQAFSELHDKTV